METENIENFIAPVEMETATLPNSLNSGFTADDLAKAREQEKAKLYPQLEKMKEELATAKRLAEDLVAREAAKTAERDAKEAEKAAQRKLKEEEELTFKELLQKKEQEFTLQLENERQERERAFALLEQERRFQELSQYRQARIEESRDDIVPELLDLVKGNSAEEIEQSIALLKEKSASIINSASAAISASRQQMAGARVTMPAAGPLDTDSDYQPRTPDAIREMSMDDYAKNRAKLLGNSASNRGQGLFS